MPTCVWVHMVLIQTVTGILGNRRFLVVIICEHCHFNRVLAACILITHHGIILYFIIYNLLCTGNIFGCKGNKLALGSFHGKYVVAEEDGAANANRNARDMWETFTVEEDGGNRVALKSFHGKYLVAEDSAHNYEVNANRLVRGPWEIFTVESQQNGRIALKTAHGRYVVAEEDGRLRGDRTVANAWEEFHPECFEGTAKMY